jgi:hypothetical protein
MLLVSLGSARELLTTSTIGAIEWRNSISSAVRSVSPFELRKHPLSSQVDRRL